MASPLPPAVAEQLQTLEPLLRLEREAEEAAVRQARAGTSLAAQEADGVLVRHLVVAEEGASSGGLWALTLRRGDGASLPALRATPGEPVGLGGPEVLASASREGEVRGVLGRVAAAELLVLVDNRAAEDLPGTKLAVWPITSPVTYERSRDALRRAAAAEDRTAHLRDVLLGGKPAALARKVEEVNVLESLNATQKLAVREAWAAPDAFMIHGPPGTGKTTTAAALALLAMQQGQRVLLCAASNGGADELTRALGKLGADVVRVGHPARVDEALHPCLLNERVRGHERYKLAQDLFRQAENLRNRSGQSRKRGPEAWAERRERQQEWRSMLADARKLIAQAEEEVLRRARAVACTLTVSGGPDIMDEQFDLGILDEASQATIPLSLLPLPRCAKFVLCGDHHQLPPTVLSLEAERRGLGKTLFDARHKDGGIPSRMLTVQHRMHRDLMAFPSAFTYGGQLEAHPAVAERTLSTLLGKDVTELGPPLQWVDTAGTGFFEDQPEGSKSQRNPGEAGLAAFLVRRFLAAGLVPEQLGVIAPYSAQVAELRSLLTPEVAAGLEVDSVDAFQGREKEVILLSLTRSNENGEMGFVEDRRRLNVAITRARCCLVILGDSATVGCRGAGAALLEHVQAGSGYGSAYTVPGFTVG